MQQRSQNSPMGVVAAALSWAAAAQGDVISTDTFSMRYSGLLLAGWVAAARTSSCRLLPSAANFSEVLTVHPNPHWHAAADESPLTCRKTSLIEMIAGLRPLTHGSRDIGETTNIGYFTQHVDDIPQNMTVINYIRCVSPNCCYRLLLLPRLCACLSRVCHECTMYQQLLLRPRLCSSAAVLLPYHACACP